MQNVQQALCPSCNLRHGSLRGPRSRQETGATTCSLCSNERDGTGRYCLSCKAQYMRGHRPKYHEMPEEARRRDAARSQVAIYVKRGKLTKTLCVSCDAERVQGHHHNGYDEPRDVIWLCAACHKAVHAGKTLAA